MAPMAAAVRAARVGAAGVEAMACVGMATVTRGVDVCCCLMARRASAACYTLLTVR